MDGEHILRYTNSARVWTEALPLGNGRIGAMVFGDPLNERIALNEDTLWSGYPRTFSPKDGPDALKEARQLLDKDRLDEAQRLIETRLTGPYTQAYMPFGDLTIERVPCGGITEYRRQLDCSDGVHQCEWREGGALFRSTVFTSFPDQCLVYHLENGSGLPLRLTAGLRSPLRGSLETSEDALTLRVECPGNARPSYVNAEEPLLYSDRPEERGVRGAAILTCIAPGGTISVSEGGLRIDCTGSVTLLLFLRTSFRGPSVHPFLEGADEIALAREDRREAEKYDYEDLLDRHRRDFSPWMERCDFTLAHESCETDTDRRLSEPDPGLYELLFHFGRYLTISASRPGTAAMNLQGIWNESVTPPWSSNYTVNINTEMNYYPTEVIALPEMHEPLFSLLEGMVQNGKHTAAAFYGLRGSTAHHNSDIWCHTDPVGEGSEGCAVWAFWPMGLLWLGRDLMQHYRYHPDPVFLKDRAYPMLREITRFALDFLTEDPEGRLRVYPATSPENSFIYQGKTVSVALHSACSNALIRSALKDYLEAARILRAEDDQTREAEQAIGKLRGYEIGSEGQLLEWDREYAEAEPHHRHVSHLVGLYPLDLIDPERTPELAGAARKTLERRGDEGTGWSLGWKICFQARLRDGDHALRLIRTQLRPAADSVTRLSGGGTYPNLFDAHPPFQIDGNFGACAGIAEMLLGSCPGRIDLLPALPDEWQNGSFRGLKAVGNITVDTEFRDGALSKAVISVPEDARLPVIVTCRGRRIALIEGTGVFTIGGEDVCM